MTNKIIFILLLVPLVFMGCYQYSQNRATNYKELTNRVGSDVVETIDEAKVVTLFSLKPQRKVLIPDGIKEYVMTVKEGQELVRLLLQDMHYSLNSKKKVIFTPQIGFRFEGKKQIWAIVSQEAKQIKFIEGQKSVVLDYDPMASSFDDFCEKLIGGTNDV